MPAKLLRSKPSRWRKAQLSILHPWMAAALLLTFGARVCAAPQEVSDMELFPGMPQIRAASAISQIMDRYHYRHALLAQKHSQKILDKFMATLDPGKMFFLGRDVERFKGASNYLYESITAGEIDIPYDVFRLYRQRVDEQVGYALQLLKRPINLNGNDVYYTDPKSVKWAAGLEALDARWQSRIKNDYILLRLAKQSDHEILSLLRKRYEGLRNRVHQMNREDVFELLMSAFAQSLDPHSDYMSARAADDFEAQMRLSLEGIGTTLGMDNDHAVIVSIVPGSPAKLSGKLSVGDRIIGVGQGKNGPIEDVVGWRLDDIADLVRGPQGTTVRLRVLPRLANDVSRIQEIVLVRNQVKLEDQAAKGYMINLPAPSEKKIGVIQLPSFYRDFDHSQKASDGFRSSTRDVRIQLNSLVNQGAQAILIDLRNNPGGALTEAVDLAGLFVPKGPVVQVKDADGRVQVEKTSAVTPIYTGPLAVLVNRESASASEIFAAAMQDYGRGYVIGEPTFGKGTVQAVLDVNAFIPGERSKMGKLIMTIQEFFRINGGSTQLRGVIPDIKFPTASISSNDGERSLDNPLPWSKIKPASYNKTKLSGIDRLARLSKQRTSSDPGFALLLSRARLINQEQLEKFVSLNYNKRLDDERRSLDGYREMERTYLLSKGVVAVDERRAQYIDEALQKQYDVLDRIEVEEAARILGDAIQ